MSSTKTFEDSESFQVSEYIEELGDGIARESMEPPPTSHASPAYASLQFGYSQGVAFIINQ